MISEVADGFKPFGPGLTVGSNFTQRPDDQAFSEASMYLVANMLPNAAAITTDIETKSFVTVPPVRLRANLSRPVAPEKVKSMNCP